MKRNMFGFDGNKQKFTSVQLSGSNRLFVKPGYNYCFRKWIFNIRVSVFNILLNNTKLSL